MAKLRWHNIYPSTARFSQSKQIEGASNNLVSLSSISVSFKLAKPKAI